MENIEKAKAKLTEAQDALVEIVGEKIVAYFRPIFVHLDHKSGVQPETVVLTDEQIAAIDAEAAVKAQAVIAAQKAENDAFEKKAQENAVQAEKAATGEQAALIDKVDAALEPKAEKTKK